MKPVTVALRYKGVEQVKAALQDIRATVEDLDKASAASANASADTRIKALRRAAAEAKRSGGAPASPGGGGSGIGGKGGGRKSSAGGRRLSDEAREAYDRATGGGFKMAAARATKGPTIAEGTGGGGIAKLMTAAGAAGAAFGLMKSAVDFAVDGLKQFGGFLISDVIKPAFALETKAQQIENSTGGAIKAKDIQDKTRTAALKHNMDPTVLLEAAEKMIDLTGDAKTSFELLDTVGMLAKGRGADAGELADFAATLKNFDPNATTDQINNLLLTQLAQGDKGSVPLKEAARLGGRLTAPAAMLAGNTDVRMASMGALMQTARKGFGSTDELATGIGNLINEVSSQKMTGSKAFLNKDGQIGDVASLISGILKKTGGDAKKIGALGLSDPAAKVVKAYLPTFAEAGKGDAGGAAVENLIRGFMEARTTIDAEKANERKVLQTSGEKWTATIEQIKNKMLAIMPEVTKLVDGLASKAPAIGEALLTLAQVMVKVASFLGALFGIEDADGGKERGVNTDATGQARGQYAINPETGKFEWKQQSDVNVDAKKNIFDANYAGEGFKLKEGPGAAPVIAPLLPPAGAAPPIVTVPSAGAPQASGAAPEGKAKVDALNLQLDALGPKVGRLGIAFDKLSESAGDAARLKPLTARL